MHDIAIANQIWDMKYRFKEQDGTIHDETVPDTWKRVADAAAQAEAPEKREAVAAQFNNALTDYKFLPAGRIIAGLGTGRNVTAFNCLSGETNILTVEDGLIPIEEVAGKKRHVIDGNGNAVETTIREYGIQPLSIIALGGGYHTHARTSIAATPNHRWVLEDGQVKSTAELVPGDKLARVDRCVDESSEDYRRGVIHGIIFGDGVGHEKNFSIRLCKEKAELAKHFSDDWTRSYPPSFEGDMHLQILRRKIWADLKELPEGVSATYLKGFFRGWLATDGCVDARDGRVILSCSIDLAAWVERYGAVVGFGVRYGSMLSEETNFGVRTKSILNLTLNYWSLTTADFLRSKHRANYKQRSFSWTVLDVSDPTEELYPVYCTEVPTTHSFLLENDVLTGNCYVMGTIPDSMDGIFTHLKEAALTMQQGGGIGYDFSTVRPQGALVKGVGADASGPLSFMDVWDAMCLTVMSAGARRGAMMATMICDHPDIENFIAAKRKKGRLTQFNLSVLVTDAFMQAVKDDADWDLKFDGVVFKTLRARDLWNTIMKSTYDYAEPGVIFIDRVNALNNLSYIENIRASNPCGEQMLPPYGACLLGSINLAKLVVNPFEKNAKMDVKALKQLVASAVRMLDNVIEVSNFPLQKQKDEAFAKRRMGLGVTGLADALLFCRTKYGSPQSIVMIEKWLTIIRDTAYRTSVELAKEKGAFPLFNKEEYLSRPFIQELPDDIREGIAKHGIRNALLTCIAPTGTISLFAGNVSGGVEPVFAYEYTRKVRQNDGSKREEVVQDYAYRLFRQKFGEDAKLPDYFVNAQTLTPMDHLLVQSAAQKYMDNSISKTINVPEDIDFDAFKDIYVQAYEMGCKGCTTYRPNDVTGSVLSVTSEKKPEQAKKAEPVLLDRPDKLIGSTYKIKWLDADHSFYVTLNDVEVDGKRLPFELFINSKNMEAFAWTLALTRMISAVFRRGGDVRFVVEELKAVFDPRGGQWMEGHYVPSLLAAIGVVIEKHLKAIGFMSADEAPLAAAPAPEATITPVEGHTGKVCPRCGSPTLVKQEGCEKCLSCDHSKCG